jgi:hypothetical protein
MEDSAILRQKLEFLETQLGDSRQREADLQWMYDSMLDSFNVSAVDIVSDELLKEKQMFEKEQADLQGRLNAQIKALESENRDLREKLQDLEYRLRTQKLTAEEQLMKTKQEAFQLQTQKTQLDLKLKALEEDDSLSKIVVSLQTKLDLLHNENEGLRNEGERELREARAAADRAVGELKQIYAEEKGELDGTVQRLTAAVSIQR